MLADNTLDIRETRYGGGRGHHKSVKGLDKWFRWVYPARVFITPPRKAPTLPFKTLYLLKLKLGLATKSGVWCYLVIPDNRVVRRKYPVRDFWFTGCLRCLNPKPMVVEGEGPIAGHSRLEGMTMVDVFAMVASMVDESDVIGYYDETEAYDQAALDEEARLDWEAQYYGR